MPKAKISVTIEQDLLTKLDEAVQGTSRSEVVEQALTSWLNSRRMRQLESDIGRYYEQMTNDDRTEDESWAELGAEHIGDSWP